MESVVVRRDISVSMMEANFYSLVFAIPAVVLPILVFTGIWGFEKLEIGLNLIIDHSVVTLFLITGSIILHELIHGVTWMLFGRKSRHTIKFGIQWKALTPYAHCTVPMGVKAYRLGAFMPGLLLGIIPAFVGIILGNGSLLLLGVLFTAAAGGDFLILWLLRSIPSDNRVEDHPTRAGCYVMKSLPEAAKVTGTL